MFFCFSQRRKDALMWKTQAEYRKTQAWTLATFKGITASSCGRTVCYCDITASSCRITVCSCGVTVCSCRITVCSCGVTVCSCRITVCSCGVTVCSCNCKAYGSFWGIKKARCCAPFRKKNWINSCWWIWFWKLFWIRDCWCQKLHWCRLLLPWQYRRGRCFWHRGFCCGGYGRC